MYAAVFIAVEVTDDDIELAEVASQCGYDFTHPEVLDVDEPVVANWHGEPCLQLRLSLKSALSPAALADLPAEAVFKLSHPSVSSIKVRAIQVCN
ncbi:hypothetical protein [Pseudomonas sp. N040]|uniref:hypothetical protein n=1 Tax=Pseudomonas sp. N040 TaxID=2785325 RepID=UPI0018A24A4A|nr:hypothetical protein [Pseudomonas sp. N040]MBF7729339.1 hypothetical protein [Pseudomonas sp. N040]MBW7012979.1 hypothetical protein [Pseudomonas sp. N040]